MSISYTDRHACLYSTMCRTLYLLRYPSHTQLCVHSYAVLCAIPNTPLTHKHLCTMRCTPLMNTLPLMNTPPLMNTLP